MKRWMKTHWVKVAFVLALAWTILNWSGLKQIKDEMDKVPIFVGLLIACEICFDIGLLLLAASAGQKIFGGSGKSPVGWFQSFRGMRKKLRELLYQDSTTNLYRWGLYMNWFGAATVTGVIPIIAVVTLLPARNWGLLVLPMLDLGATFMLRIPAAPRRVQAQEKVAV